MTRILLVLAIMVMPVVTFAQSVITVTGTVTDDTDQPVIGASVMVKGSTTGVPTDLDGKYSIDVPADAVLEFSSVGLRTVDMPVNGRAVINVVLDTDNTFLESVVVVGYGTQKKGSISGAVSAVNNDDIIKTKSENVQNMLTGRIAGLRVYQKSAEPGSYKNDMDIRGMGTPLVIIDGVPRDVADFQRLNSADIENVSVLKDAAAAIYGLRGGNGVILVTTKKGNEGKAKVSYNGSFTFQTPSRMPELASVVDAMTVYNEKGMNAVHNGALAFREDLVEQYRSGALSGEDWNSIILADWSPQTQHDLSISGGTEKIQYYVSMGYTFQDSFFKSGDLNYSKYNLRSNISAELVKGLKLKETLSYDYNIQKDSRYYNPLSSAGPKSGSDARTAKGFIEYGKINSSTSLNYIHTFAGKHHLDVLAAYELERYDNDHAVGEAYRLPSDILTEPDNAAVIFALALLMAGISSTITSGMAAGSIFAGMFGESYHIKDSHSQVGVVLSLGVALLLIFFIGDPFKGLLISQMVLSLQLPFTVFLQVGLTSSRRVMGPYANSRWSSGVLYFIASVVTVLNIWLIVSELL